MGDFATQVGVTRRIHFEVVDPATGLADASLTTASFTLQIVKNTTGNQATTGVTFFEPDPVNNPGHFCIECSGTTSFVSATGEYGLVIFVTADTTRRWTQSVYVTSDGTMSGSFGDASFTAVASNGRIMSGGSPLQDAIVKIVFPSGVLYVQTVSDSSGLWGPVYFNVNGTYTIQVYRSGYTTTTSTIVVTGATATGPGTDLSITASSTTSTILVSRLMGYCRRRIGDHSGTKADIEILEIINEAAEMVAMECYWDFYLTKGSIATQPPYSTGTVTATNGSTTVTLSGGTWPSYAASCDILINGVWAEVATRSSGTTILLADAWGEPTVTTTFTLVQYRYALPASCAKIDDTQLGQRYPFNGRFTSAKRIEFLKDQSPTGLDSPVYWSIEKNFMVLWPYPTTTRQINFLYFRKPVEVTASDTLDWDAQQVGLLRRAIDYVAVLRTPITGTDYEGANTARRLVFDAYKEELSKALTWNRTAADQGDQSRGMPYDLDLDGDVIP